MALAVHRLQGALQSALQSAGASIFGRPADAAGVEQAGQILGLEGVRRLMRPKQGAAFAAFQESGRADIGGDHGLLDEAMGIVAQDWRNVDHSAVFQGQGAFPGVEIQGPPPFSGAAQRPVGIGQGGEGFGHRRLHRQLLPFKEGPDLGVGEPLPGANHRLAEAELGNLARCVDPHVAGQGQPVLPGAQGAQAVGQGFRQHGNDPIRQIDGSAPLPSLLIQGAAGLHILGDIGDGDQQPPAALPGFGEHRIVEIPSRFAINGCQRQRPQILPPRMLAGANLLRQAAGRLTRRGRPFSRDGELRQNRLRRPVGRRRQRLGILRAATPPPGATVEGFAIGAWFRQLSSGKHWCRGEDLNLHGVTPTST